MSDLEEHWRDVIAEMKGFVNHPNAKKRVSGSFVAGVLYGLAGRMEDAMGRDTQKTIDKLVEMRRIVRKVLKEAKKKEQDSDPLESMGFAVGAMLFVGARFGITACILEIKHRMKDPDGDAKMFKHVCGSLDRFKKKWGAK